MNIRTTSVAALAAVPLALAGCSQPQPEQSPQAQPPAEKPQGEQAPAQGADGVKWVGQLCGLVGGFAQSQQKGPGVDKSSAEAFKQSSIAQIDSAEQAANDTVSGLQGLGPSPINGGDKVNTTFQDSFVQVTEVLRSAKGKAEGVDTSNEQTFKGGMLAVQEELKRGEQISFNKQFEEFDKNKELNQAAMKAPECQALMTPPAPPPGQQPPPPGQ